MSPIPGWQVIPPRFAEHHRPTAEATMTATATIKRISDGPAPYPAPDDWDGSQTIWTGPARVQELKREGNNTPAEQPTTFREYLVPVPLEGLPELRAGERGDVVHVLGRQLRII